MVDPQDRLDDALGLVAVIDSIEEDDRVMFIQRNSRTVTVLRCHFEISPEPAV